MSFLEPVPYSADRLYLPADISQFPAETEDVDINRSLRHRVVVAFGGVHDLGPGEDPPGPPGKKKEDIELCEGDRDGNTIRNNLASTGVDSQASSLEDEIGRASGRERV